MPYVEVSVITVGCFSILSDLRTRRIPNYLTLSAMLLGLGLHGLESGFPGFLDALGGLGLGFGVLLVFYIAGGMGAGDVKLMGGMGALLGVKATALALVITALAGGVMAVGTIVAHRAWKDTMYRLMYLVTVRGRIPDGDRGQADAGPGRLAIPYGVAIGVGSLLAMILQK